MRIQLNLTGGGRKRLAPEQALRSVRPYFVFSSIDLSYGEPLRALHRSPVNGSK
jgi:hypothetical protein